MSTQTAPTTLTTEGVENLLRDAEAALKAARNENARAKAIQARTACEKALQAARRRDRQVAAGHDTTAAAILLGERIDHLIRIQNTPEKSWFDPSFVCR